MTRTIQVLIFAVFLTGFIAFSYFIGITHLPLNSYNQMESAYKAKNYDKALAIYGTLGKERNEPPYQLLLAWINLNTHQYKAAERLFKKILAANPQSDEARLGLGYSNLYSGHLKEAFTDAESLYKLHPHNGEYALFLAECYYRSGDNGATAELYLKMIDKGIATQEAKKRYRELFGDEYFEEHDLKTLLPPFVPPTTLQMPFRTQGNYFEIKGKESWQPFFVRGINLSATPPGHAVTEPAKEIDQYRKWFLTMEQMHANIVRIYTILPPAFYKALKEYNETHSEKIWLLQGIWFKERSVEDQGIVEAYDIYDPSWIETFKKEIVNTIDAVNGRANIPFSPGEAAGYFTADVSPYLFGYLIGRELEPYLAFETNKAHPDITTFEGTYFTLNNGNASEAWIAMMCDYAAGYETRTYNSRHPLSAINWPPLDGFEHPTEGGEADLKALFAKNKIPWDRTHARNTFDANIVKVETKKIVPTKNFENSYFITFHVYPSWPNFIIREEPYKSAKDQLGTNPWLGYLLALRQSNDGLPFLLGEFGLSTSWIPSHFSPGTWNHGGLTEKEQGEGLSRMIQGAVDAGCAGCCIFEFQDAWWKVTPTSAPFDIANRKPYWLNLYNAEESYGLVNYEAPPPIPLLRGQESDWSQSISLASSPPFKNLKRGRIKKLRAYSDATFFYIALDIASLNQIDWNNKEYWIALSTLPGEAGTLRIDELNLSIPTGANFLIKLKEEHQAEILISTAYNPFHFSDPPLPFLQGEWLAYKNTLFLELLESSPFEEILYLTNGFSYSKNGEVYPPIYANRSLLHYGIGDPNSPEYMSHAAYYSDPKSGMLEIRLPWSLLYMLDPSQRIAMAGIEKVETQIEHRAFGKQTEGFALVALEIEKVGDAYVLLSSMPALRGRSIPRENIHLYQWPQWTMPPYSARLKTGFENVKAAYGKLKNAPSQKTR